MRSFLFTSIILVLPACGIPRVSVPGTVTNDRTVLGVECTLIEADTVAELSINKIGSEFDIRASTQSQSLFDITGQRPSLNVRVEDGTSQVANEFVDFKDKGLVVVPVESPKKLEIELGVVARQVKYSDGNKLVQMTCPLGSKDLLSFLDIAPKSSVFFPGVKAVAFDIDDTLMFTSPAFARGFATGGSPKPDDVLFWTHTNGCDAGCPEVTITLPNGTTKVLPANGASSPKAKAVELIKYHRAMGHEVYAITARPDINGDSLRDFLESQMGIDAAHIYFEPDMDQTHNPAGKTDRIESLNLDIFYGDSDSDITDTLNAFVDSSGVRRKKVEPIRFLRSPKSSNRKAGMLNKYHPGYFGEPILADSY